MRKTFLNSADVVEIQARLAQLTAESTARWGRMNASQMVCHLNDSFSVAMGQRTEPSISNLVSRLIVKPIALWAPMTWPKNVATVPGMDQFIGGTPPAEFTADREALKARIQRFAENPPTFRFGAHPMFREMTREEWMRWGYLHCDHHFRQFGV